MGDWDIVSYDLDSVSLHRMFQELSNLFLDPQSRHAPRQRVSTKPDTATSTDNATSPKKSDPLSEDPTNMNINALKKTLAQPESLDLKDTILSNYRTGNYSDLTIRDKAGKEYRVHKNIVCTRCVFFAKAVESGFKESFTSVIEMSNDPPSAVKTLIEYLYTDKYSDPFKNQSVDSLLLHLEAFIMGEIYEVKGLKTISHTAFHNIANDKSICPTKVIPLCVERIYESIPEQSEKCKMKASIVLVSACHLYGLLHDSDFTDKLASIPAFAEALGKKTMALYSKEFPLCESCRTKVVGTT